MKPQYLDMSFPLADAEHDFLEVLLTDFIITRYERGSKLILQFDDTTPAIWQRKSVRQLLHCIPDFARKSALYQAQLDALLLGRSTESVYQRDPDFPFRYVSGGSLPVVLMGGKEYYCLIYREAFPTGWNIANGAADSRYELLNPFEAIERELREEILIFDLANKKRYVFDADNGRPQDRPEFVAARRLWERRAQEPGFPAFDDCEEMLLPVKWLDGPDAIEIHNPPNAVREIRGCFLNVNAEDFGIEADRIAKISLPDEVILCDGELLNGQLLNRVVGLFDVERMHAAVLRGERSFTPDLFFHDCKLYRTPAMLEEVLRTRYLPHVQSLMPSWAPSQWEELPYKFDLCPVTRRIIHRAAAGKSDNSLPAQTSDIFISFAHEDLALARLVAESLKGKTRGSIFFYPEHNHASFGEAIDEALGSANCLVSVASKPQHLNKPWPRYEHRMFHMLCLGGKKPVHAQMLSYVSGFPPAELPLPLLYYQAVEHNAYNPEQSISEITRFIATALKG